jgi:hypothetical protein
MAAPISPGASGLPSDDAITTNEAAQLAADAMALTKKTDDTSYLLDASYVDGSCVLSTFSEVLLCQVRYGQKALACCC